MTVSPYTVNKRNLKKLVACARLCVKAPFNRFDRDANEDFDADNGAIEWVQSLAYSISDVRAALQAKITIRFLDSRGVWCFIEPDRAMRRLITIARRDGFEEADAVRSALFDSLSDADLGAPRTPALWHYKVTMRVEGRQQNSILGTVVVEAPNKEVAQHMASTALWNPRAHAGIARYVVERLSDEQIADYLKHQIQKMKKEDDAALATNPASQFLF